MQNRKLFYPENCFVIEPFKYSKMNIKLRKLYKDFDNLSNICKQKEEENNNENLLKNRNRKKLILSKSNVYKNNIYINNNPKNINSQLILYSKNKKILNNTFNNSKKSKNKSSSNLSNYKNSENNENIENNIENNVKMPLLNIRPYLDKKIFTNEFPKTHRAKIPNYLKLSNKFKNNHSPSFINKMINNKESATHDNRKKFTYLNLFKSLLHNDSNNDYLSSRNEKNIRLIKENMGNSNNKNENIIDVSKNSSKYNIQENNDSNISIDYNIKKKDKDINNIDLLNLNQINNNNLNINILSKNDFKFEKIKKIRIKNKKVKYNIFKKREKNKFFKDIKEIEKDSEDKQKLIEKDKTANTNKALIDSKSMALLKISKGDFYEEIELESKEEAKSYQRKIGQFYRKFDEGLYTGHFFTVLRKDHFFGNDYLIHKTPKYYD